MASAEELGAKMVLDKEIVISSLVVMRCKLPPSGVDGTKVLEGQTMGCVIRARALANSGRRGEWGVMTLAE